MKCWLTIRSSGRIIAILGLSFISSCATEDNTARQMVNAPHNGAWPMRTNQRLLKHSLTFGGYQTSEIGTVRSTGTDSVIRVGKIGKDADVRNANLQFDLTTPGGEVLQVTSQVNSNRNGVSLAKFAVTTELASLIAGTISFPNGAVCHFEFKDFVPLAARQPSAQGRIHLPGRGEIAVAFTDEAVPPKSGIRRLVDRASVAFVRDGRRVGLLDGYMQRSVWIDPNADEQTQHAIAASCAVLVEMSQYGSE
jgi:hypothetical protein